MIAQFALRLICGMSLMWALMPRRQVTSGFFRIQMLVVMGLGALAGLSAGMEMQSITGASQQPSLGSLPFLMSCLVGLIALLGLLGFFGSMLWTLERRTAAERVGFAVLFVSAALIVVPQFIPKVVIDSADAVVVGAFSSVTASYLIRADHRVRVRRRSSFGQHRRRHVAGTLVFDDTDDVD